jgi:transcriptional regulator GlxA family with amidase domain
MFVVAKCYWHSWRILTDGTCGIDTDTRFCGPFIAGTASPFYGIDVRFFASATGQFRSRGGLAVTVDSSLQQCLDWKPDVVVVIGGMVWESAEAPDIRGFLHASRSNGATIAGICGGTLALARAGLFDTVPHNSNSADFLEQNAVGY